MRALSKRKKRLFCLYENYSSRLLLFIYEIVEIYIFNSKKKKRRDIAREIRKMDFWPFDRILVRVLQTTGQRSFLTGSK